MIVHCCASVKAGEAMMPHYLIILITCMTTRRSAFPVRISYSVKVRSEPILASTEDSARLNLIAEIVSVEVGNVRLDIGALLCKVSFQ